jgi:glycogen operon protein
MVDLSPESRSLAFCLHGASQGDNDIYVMINAYWQALQFQIQEGAREDWLRIVDTNLPTPHDFSESGLPLQQLTYQVAPRSLVVLRAQNKTVCSREDGISDARPLTVLN